MKHSQILCSLLASVFFLLIFSLRLAIAGSPFYLTIERSFANTENPQIRLDYTTTDKPMLVRVLRPQNLERFLDGQLQISRSYEQPLSELNPGYFFITGVNKMESPLKSFRSMLDRRFRASFKETSFSKAIQNTTPGSLVTPPEEIIHGPPAGFTVVRDTYLDLKYLGKEVNDLGWWFGDQAWSEDRYKIRKITLDPLPDGVYLIQAVQGKTEAQCLMQVSSLSVQVKQSTAQLVVRVINRQLEPVAGASVSYRDSRGSWVSLDRKTDQAGEVVYTHPSGTLDGKLVIKVDCEDGRQALVDTDFLPTVANDDAVFILTDRPIFKPGETFFYKGTVRTWEKGQLNLPQLGDKPEAAVSLIPFNGPPTDLRTTVPLTRFATFSGSFALNPEQPPGLYRLVAEIDNKPYGGELRVRDYVKPTFYLEIIDRSPTVIPGNRFFVKFKAKRYSGGVPANVKYEVFLYRKKFEAPQWVVEAGGGLSAGPNYQGEIKSTSALTEPKRIYSSVEKRLAENGSSPANTWDSAPLLDSSGEATYAFDLPKIESGADQEWTYTLMVRALEPSGSLALVSENIYHTLAEAQATVQFSKTVAQVAEKGLEVRLHSSYPDGKPAPGAGGTVNVLLERAGAKAEDFIKLPFTTDEKGDCRLGLPAIAQQGRLRAVAVLETLAGRPMTPPGKSEPALMIVGGTQGEAVLDNQGLELYTPSTILSPGEKAQVLALPPRNWGKNETGLVWETIAGNRIHTTKGAVRKGRSHWFEVEAKPEYGTGFYHTVSVPVSGGRYAEQSLGFRIIPWNQRLHIAVQPEREEAEPLKPFRIHFEVKNANNAPAADTELAVTIVDRAVYAVQPEFRPGIFDFFYPLARLNLGTFYSDELQGYGFADILKKPNFKLGALKSQSKITKKSLRDTAGWFPHVVTDGQGKASITVDLPGNITEWLITAVAADKEGRVGEAKEKFRTRTDISQDLLAPQFLRQGEEVALQLKSVNHLARDIGVTSTVEVSGEGQLKTGGQRTEFTLAGQGEHLQPLVLAARGERGAATLKAALTTGEKIQVGGAEEFDIPLKAAAMQLVFAGVQQGDQLATRLPAAAIVNELKVQVRSGLLGAALQAASTLVAYPYGCTEQLVHATIPNLVLMDLIRRAGISPDQLGSLAEPLTKAEKNGALGIKKIRQNQKASGGFGFWPSDPEASPPVTVLALSALKYAKELKIEGAETAFEQGMMWLATQKQDQVPTAFSPFAGYLLSQRAALGNDRLWKYDISYVKTLAQQPQPSLLHLIYGLKLFAAHKDQSWSRFNEELKGTNLKTILIEQLTKALSQLDGEAGTKPATDAEFFHSLGFGFGQPYLLSSALGVLDDLDALPPDLEDKLKHLLLGQMKNGYWTSTFDSAQVIFNLRGILGKEAAAFAQAKKGPARKVLVRKKDGTELGLLSPIPSGFTGRFPDPGPPELLAQIQVEGLTRNEFVSSAITAKVPYQAVEPQSKGVLMTRRLLRVTPTGHEVLDPARPLLKGDTVISEVTLRRDPAREDRTIQSRFLVVEDGIPSFAQAVDEDRTALADAKIQPNTDEYWTLVKQTLRYPDRTVRMVQVQPRGEIKLYQVWQVTFAGTATIPPAHAFDMYDESVQGHTGAQPCRAQTQAP